MKTITLVLGFVKRLNPVRGLEHEGYVMQGTDPGFSAGEGAKPHWEGEGHQHMILPNCLKNCMKLRTFWAAKGCAPGVPLDPI